MRLKHPLTRESLVEFLEGSAVDEHHLQLLRWLIWFPLLSTPELARLMERAEKTVAATLREMEDLDLAAHVTLSEPDASHHFRYYAEDLGLYVFAAKATPPLSVPRLVQAYAVDHDDLLARLVRPDLLRTLADVATRLVAEGRAVGYPLVSYQQPWQQTDTIFGRRQTMHFDAALLLRHPQGTEHACYLRVDSIEGRLFHEKRERLHPGRLLGLRETLLLQREQAPRLLIVTHASRLMAWAQLLEGICNERATALIEGGITTFPYLDQGVHAPIWWSFDTLLHWANEEPTPPLPTSPVPLVELLGPPVSFDLAERFSQRETFAHLLTERNSGPLRKTKKPLPSYVGNRLDAEAATLHKQAVADALTGTKAEQREACALLSLVLSGGQKEILIWLSHHPLLTIHDLAALLVPTSGDIRVLQRQMSTLDLLGLLVPFKWWKADAWQRRERYLLSEAALRYIALRDGLPSTSYLLPARDKKNDGPLSVQQCAAWLFAQMPHTDGLYCCVSQLMHLAHVEQVRIVIWKSAHEAIRWYRHPFGQESMQIRPDAELLYLLPGENIPRTLLLEYDRATAGRRGYEGKFGAYADYQEHVHTVLPPIVVITPGERSAQRIREVLSELAPCLRVVIVLEAKLATGHFFQSLQGPL